MTAELLRRAGRRPLFEPGATTVDVEIGADDIARMLPHRAPFLFVDRISRVDLDAEGVVAHRRIDALDPVFEGHFPEDPVYPGALLVEAIGQAGLCLHHLLVRGRTRVEEADIPDPVRLLRVHGAAFFAPVLPGDTVELVGQVIERDALTVRFAGQVRRSDGAYAAAAISEVYLVEAPEEGSDA